MALSLKSLGFYLLLLLVFYTNVAQSRNKVIDLHEENWEQMLKDEWMVELYVDSSDWPAGLSFCLCQWGYFGPLLPFFQFEFIFNIILQCKCKIKCRFVGFFMKIPFGPPFALFMGVYQSYCSIKIFPNFSIHHKNFLHEIAFCEANFEMFPYLVF